jgi:hypothetical protein
MKTAFVDVVIGISECCFAVTFLVTCNVVVRQVEAGESTASYTSERESSDSESSESGLSE